MVAPVAVLDEARPARAAVARVQDAQADAVLLERGQGPAVEDVAQGAFRVAFDATGPREPQRPVLVERIEGDGERLVARVHAQGR